MIAKFFEEQGFCALKLNRAGVKFNGQRIKDAGLGGEMFHMNIRPMNGDILGAFYPEQVRVQVKGPSSSSSTRSMSTRSSPGESATRSATATTTSPTRSSAAYTRSRAIGASAVMSPSRSQGRLAAQGPRARRPSSPR